ncbi:hypothetical protein PIB30_085120 [Stylosanthes scabra]|uniref:Uncharacterized protein n=1 Tax=Stylosanthes scabra TaxID=79078 RepID=A0ABU6YRN4_9FABA|nr:hypothetical protein [Stylosanthes scabra]
MLTQEHKKLIRLPSIWFLPTTFSQFALSWSRPPNKVREQLAQHFMHKVDYLSRAIFIERMLQHESFHDSTNILVLKVLEFDIVEPSDLPQQRRGSLASEEVGTPEEPVHVGHTPSQTRWFFHFPSATTTAHPYLIVSLFLSPFSKTLANIHRRCTSSCSSSPHIHCRHSFVFVAGVMAFFSFVSSHSVSLLPPSPPLKAARRPRLKVVPC